MDEKTSALDPATLELISKIEGFYSSAFSILLTVISISFIIVGIIIPYLISRQQKKEFSILLEQAKSDFKEQMTESETAIQKQHKEKIEFVMQEQKNIVSNEINKLNEEFENIKDYADGTFAHIEAWIKYIDAQYASATKSAIISADYLYHVKNKFPDQYKTSLGNIINAINMCTKKDLEENEPLIEAYDCFMETLQKDNSDGKNNKDIKLIENGWDLKLKEEIAQNKDEESQS